MVWTEYKSGSQTAVIGTEHTIAGTGDTQDLPVGALYVFAVDLTNMQATDAIEIRAYVKVRAADTLKLYDIVNLSGIQQAPAMQSIPVVGGSGLRFTLKQTSGTGRAFPWSVQRAP
jgi:hypothetical protein